jgi:hypothetical protein
LPGSAEDGCRNAKRPRGFPAGAIPTVDFLLHHFGRFVKKVGVKTHDEIELTTYPSKRNSNGSG